MKHSRFELSYFLQPGDKFHIARVNITSKNDLSCHRHDYAELFWVEKGAGYHNVNGYKIRIEEGDIVMVRPDDSHCFIPSSKGLTIINIAFGTETLDYFHGRYFPDSNIYFWSRSMFPYMVKVPKDVLKRISARAEESMQYRRSNIQLDSMLLFIFRQLTAYERVLTDVAGVPIWLFNAVKQYNNPEFFRGGTASFVELCGRNISYVNRVVRKYYGKTLTDLINEFKIQYAKTQLFLTDMPIKEICYNCGFRNMGHFYEVFKSICGQPPLQYRRVNQMIV